MHRCLEMGDQSGEARQIGRPIGPRHGQTQPWPGALGASLGRINPNKEIYYSYGPKYQLCLY